MWFKEDGKEKDVVVSTRIRLARNLVDYPFDPRMNRVMAEEILEKLKKAYGPENGYECSHFSDKSREEQWSYVEQHLVSREFVQKETPHELFVRRDRSLYVMGCEEDHVRITCVLAGLNLDQAFASVCEADELLDQYAQVAFSEKYGYLTHCPTNLGTGMRASVMMFLPALTANRQIGYLQDQLSKIGLTIRGMSGEGSEGKGCLYQVSNQVTLGISEEDTLKKLSDVIEKIAKNERSLREQWKNEPDLTRKDRVMRAWGTMMFAQKMSSEELMGLYAQVRLGSALGYVAMPAWKLDELLFTTMPASLEISSGRKHPDPVLRDAHRAEQVRNAVASC